MPRHWHATWAEDEDMRRREEQLEPPIVLKNIYFPKVDILTSLEHTWCLPNFVLFRWLCRMWQNVAGYPRLGPYYPSTGYDSDSAILYSIPAKKISWLCRMWQNVVCVSKYPSTGMILLLAVKELSIQWFEIRRLSTLRVPRGLLMKFWWSLSTLSVVLLYPQPFLTSFPCFPPLSPSFAELPIFTLSFWTFFFFSTEGCLLQIYLQTWRTLEVYGPKECYMVHFFFLLGSYYWCIWVTF